MRQSLKSIERVIHVTSMGAEILRAGAGVHPATYRSPMIPPKIPGMCHYPNGNSFTGSWKAGKPCGEGTQTFANGDRYVGGWKDGMMSGQVLNTNMLLEVRSGVTVIW